MKIIARIKVLLFFLLLIAVITLPQIYGYIMIKNRLLSTTAGMANTPLQSIANTYLMTILASVILSGIAVFLLIKAATGSLGKIKKTIEQLERNLLNTNDPQINHLKSQSLASVSDTFATISAQILQQETSLLQKEQKMETLMQSMSEAVIAVDQNSKILLFNKTAERLTGFALQTVITKPIDDILHLYGGDESLVISKYLEHPDQLEKIYQEKNLNLKSQNGNMHPVAVSISTVTFQKENIQGWIVTIIDKSGEKQLEEMKLDFVSMAAHELRTPLTVIRGYAELLNTEIGDKLDPEHREHLHRLEYNASNLGTLIDNLLNVSRIERGSYKIEPAPLDLVSLVRNVVTDLSDQANSKGQTLMFTEPQEKYPSVLADQFRITQVMSNLINNAITYTPVGESITVSIEKKDTHLAVSVKDTGIGIPKEAQSKLFTKFFRVNSVLEQGSKGTGLGLFISKSIIDMHKGTINVESEIGKGSTFIFTLPITAGSAPTQSVEPGEKKYSGRGIMINKERLAQLYGTK